MFCLAAFLSGVAALVYEVLWVRQLGALLGSTAYAVSVVLTVFFLGLGIGAWVVGRFVDRAPPKGTHGRFGRIGRPLLVFCALEGTIAVAGVLFWPASEALDGLYVSLAPADWPIARALGAKALIALVLLTIPTFCMGATLPALVRHVSDRSARFTFPLGLLYGTNTVGAAVGVFAAVFLLIPRLGLPGAGLAAAGLNVAAVLVALRGAALGSSSTQKAAATHHASSESSPGRRVALLLAGWSGFVSVGLEVLWTRAMATRFLSTIYSFAAILTVYLLCLGAGSLIVLLLDRHKLVGRRAAALVMIGSGLGAILSILFLARLPAVQPTEFATRGGIQLAEFGQALSVMVLPTLLLGLSFPLLGRTAHREGGGVGRSVGSLYLANTLGAVAAPAIAGFVLMPVLGLKASLLVIAWGALIAGLAMLSWAGFTDRRRSWLGSGALALAVLLMLGLPEEVGLWREAPGDRLLYHHDGAAASIAVVETDEGNRLLKVDNSYRLGTTRHGFAQARQGLIPFLLAEEPRKVLFIGLGTGGSAGPVAACGAETDILEIVPGLRATLPLFSMINEDLERRLEHDPRVRLFETDGRHFVRTTDRQYDVVVGDLYVPWRAGEGAMYTSEHLQAVREVLSPNGLFCQWLPLYQLRPPELRAIVATFCDVFPFVEAFWLYFNVEQPAIGLIGGREPIQLDLAALEGRLVDSPSGPIFVRAGLADGPQLLGSWIAGRERLSSWSADAPRETRARPRIEFAAPYTHFRGEGADGSLTPAAENVPIMLALTEPVSASGPWSASSKEALALVGRYQRSIGHFFRARHALVYQKDIALAVDALNEAMRETPDWGWIAWNLENVLEKR